jgi:DNA-binding NtrC family response regulator
MDGLEVLRALREADETALAVVMTAYPEVRTAIASLKAGAPTTTSTSRSSSTTSRSWCAARAAPIDGMIGASPAFVAMLEVTRKIAAGRVPVLIRGEFGTGKERVAQAIHALSARAAGPWITLNCSALAEGLMESEMFGHERGAFTDAKNQKQGLLELADGGTLFLDESGDLAPALQPKLLRALETQTFRRVGGKQELRVDVRFVAATNRDLEAMVRSSSFREDLYYRLNVGLIDVPPLRSRRADILPLAAHFLEEAAGTMGLPQPELDPAAQPLLERYGWPGNVRELRNVMERALILSAGAPIVLLHLPREIAAPAAERVSTEPGLVPLAEIERRHIRRVLEACAGNKTQAAKLLGITRLTPRSKIAEYGWGEFMERPEAAPAGRRQ